MPTRLSRRGGSPGAKRHEFTCLHACRTHAYGVYIPGIYRRRRPMSVRQALLALLEEGPMYGYQLRSEFERRTGATWPLNVGQVYTTLTRLERDGLVAQLTAQSGGEG